MCRILILITIVVICFTGSIASENTIDRLSGIKGVAIRIFMDDDICKLGLSEKSIRVTTELTLRRNGINIVDIENTDDNILDVDFRTMEIYNNTYVIIMRIDLYQRAIVSSNGSVSNLIGWSSGAAITSNATDVTTKSKDALQEYVESFINDVLAANPKVTK